MGPDVPAFEPRTWTLTIQPPRQFVTANDRMGKYERAAAVAAWRAAAWAAAKLAKLPIGLDLVRIDVVIRPDNDRHDPSNLDPTCKPIVDGLGPPFVRKPNPRKGYKGAAAPGYGLIPNDNARHLDGHYLHVETPHPPRGLVTVIIVDLDGVAPGRSWTPHIPLGNGERMTVKRCCNGCGRPLGDVTTTEINAAMNGGRLTDVRGECPVCAPLLETRP